MNVGLKNYFNSSNSCLDISLKSTTVKLTKGSKSVNSENYKWRHIFMATDSISQIGPRCWTGRPTVIAIPRTSPPAWLIQRLVTNKVLTIF